MSRDIVHEGLGFNISMQFLMIPFTFCTQTRYVATTGYTSSSITLLAVFTIYGINDSQILKNIFCLFYKSKQSVRFIFFLFIATGYWIYRASNLEKNKFRQNPEDPSVASRFQIKESVM